MLVFDLSQATARYSGWSFSIISRSIVAKPKTPPVGVPSGSERWPIA